MPQVFTGRRFPSAGNGTGLKNVADRINARFPKMGPSHPDLWLRAGVAHLPQALAGPMP